VCVFFNVLETFISISLFFLSLCLCILKSVSHHSTPYENSRMEKVFGKSIYL